MPKSLYSPAYVALTEILAETRKRVGVGQVELAARLGTAQSYVSRVETGERRMDVFEFYSFLNALGVDPQKVFASLMERWSGETDG